MLLEAQPAKNEKAIYNSTKQKIILWKHSPENIYSYAGIETKGFVLAVCIKIDQSDHYQRSLYRGIDQYAEEEEDCALMFLKAG